MACEEFRNWISETGLVKAAGLISDHEVSKDREGVSYQSVQDWLKADIPPTRILAIEAVTGISRHALNPAIYPEEAA